MAPNPGVHQSAIASDFERPYPPLARSSTAPVNLTARVDPAHLAPEDAFASPPRRLSTYDSGGGNGSGSDLRGRRAPRDGTSRSRSRRRKRTWRKLLWVKQSYPDNYTDQATFLENLQRNPRLQPYEFWPLVADSTVIVQHVCSVIIFVVCFVGIFQERLSPVSVVGCGSFATFVGWSLWDWWVGQDDGEGAVDELVRPSSVESERPYREYRGSASRPNSGIGPPTPYASNTSVSSFSNYPSAASSTSNLVPGSGRARDNQTSQRPSLTDAFPGTGHSSSQHLEKPLHSTSAVSLESAASQTSGYSPSHAARNSTGTDDAAADTPWRRPTPLPQKDRASLRLSTVKSAILIYFTLLGLSPILKSLTRSTSSDSIWAISFWLLAINIFFCDYSGTWVGVTKFPVASLSTNAALMASTVLASRLPSTGQVFSLTLFSIEVFGLFPVFRRYARHQSWRYHVALTVLLVLGAGAGVGMILDGGDEPRWPWKGGVIGMAVGCLMAALAMGGCSWWLIGLQKYKNEIYGPWDPARPVIISRRHWDHD